MEFVLSTTKHVAKNHKIIFFHNDTRIFGDWVGTHVTSREKPAINIADPMHRFFRDVIFGEDLAASSLSRLRLAHTSEARVELDIQVSGVWYQKLHLELDGTSRWSGQEGNFVLCKTYWKMRKLVVLIDDKNQQGPDESSLYKMLVINVLEDDPSQLVLSLKWTSDCVYRKVYKRVTSKEILLMDKYTQRE